MPEDLRKAHRELDITVDRLYRNKPYESDEERMEWNGNIIGHKTQNGIISLPDHIEKKNMAAYAHAANSYQPSNRIRKAA